MNLHYHKLARFIETLFIVWFVLASGGILGFNFGINTSLLFKVSLTLLIVFVVLEIVNNREFVKLYLRKKVEHERHIYYQGVSRVRDGLKEHLPVIAREKVYPSLTVIILAYAYAIIPYLFYTVKNSRTFHFMLLSYSIIVVFYDIFIFKTTNSLTYCFVAILWLLSVILNRLESKSSFIGGIVMLSLCPIFIISKHGDLAEKTAAWAYIFLVVGLVQIIYEYQRELKHGSIEEEITT